MAAAATGGGGPGPVGADGCAVPAAGDACWLTAWLAPDTAPTVVPVGEGVKAAAAAHSRAITRTSKQHRPAAPRASQVSLPRPSNVSLRE